MKKKMNSTTPKITSSPHQPPEESSNGLRSNKTSKVVAPDERMKKLYRKGPAAYGSVKSLQKASKLPEKTVENFIHTQNAYTKHKTYRKKFPRLKVKVFDLNEIWSLDLAHVDKLAKYNGDVNYLLVAVDCLSRYLRVQPMKSKYATTCMEAFKKMIKVKQPKKVWVDQGTEFKGSFKNLCEKKGIELYTTHSEKNRHLLSEISDH